ncbi:MAG: hypothetical protein AUH39_02765 [Chloroflexi bacterium 13_1_40CM_67_9]|nr:MAG: hypothetical protein AUH39_02765 [Chloroflexi bacterium 13_1_40CM_67_9]
MTTRPTVRAANGLVASGHHLATSAGLAALREGGNAADAAVAAAAVCAVVMPHRTSIGGDMFALTYDARSRDVTRVSPISLPIMAFSAWTGRSGRRSVMPRTGSP